MNILPSHLAALSLAHPQPSAARTSAVLCDTTQHDSDVEDAMDLDTVPASPSAAPYRPMDAQFSSPSSSPRPVSPFSLPEPMDTQEPRDPIAQPLPPVHQAIEDNQLLQLTALLASGADIHATDHEGMTPLHLAAKLEDTGVIHTLLQRGARLDLRNKRGHTPLQTALVYRAHGAALLLAQETLRRPTQVTPWPATETVRASTTGNAVVAQYADANSDDIDKLTLSLTHADWDLNNYPDLFKYYTHLGSVTGRFGGLVTEGWNFTPMLWQRVRTLVTLLVKPLPVAPPAPFTEAGMRAVLVQELTNCLRSLHIAEVCSAIRCASDEVQKTTTLALGREIVTQALALQPGEELTVPIGTYNHAIYAGLRPTHVHGVPVLQCRIDNLGAGSRRSHVQDKASGKYAALHFALPLDALQEKGCYDAFTQLVASLLHDMGDCEVTVKMLYARVLAFAQQAYGDAGALDVEDAGDTRAAQSAGNCVLKNHTAAMGAHFTHAARSQLGSAASTDAVNELGTKTLRWFKECERHVAIAHIEEAVTAKRMWGHYREEAVQRLSDIVTDRDARRNGRLERFFAKPDRDTLARKLTAIQLADVVRYGEVGAMALLLQKGVDLAEQNALPKSTLLHQAVRSGNPAMVTLLLQHGADPKACDAEGRTPGALARELGSGPALAALVLHGGTSAVDDTEQTLLKQMAMLQEALGKLHEGTSIAPVTPTAPPNVPAAPVQQTVVVMCKDGVAEGTDTYIEGA